MFFWPWQIGIFLGIFNHLVYAPPLLQNNEEITDPTYLCVDLVTFPIKFVRIKKGPVLTRKRADSNGILVMFNEVRPPLRLLSEAEQARGARIPKRLGGGWDMSGRPAGRPERYRKREKRK